MKCPNDETVLLMSDRQGVEIDYCPTCRGVWLDRGELDKIVEKSQATTHSSADTQNNRAPEYTQKHQERTYRDNPPYQKRKKESFLGDLFDF